MLCPFHCNRKYRFVLFSHKKNALGQQLVKKVLMNLDLVEKDYFGLQFMDTKQVPVSNLEVKLHTHIHAYMICLI